MGDENGVNTGASAKVLFVAAAIVLVGLVAVIVAYFYLYTPTPVGNSAPVGVSAVEKQMALSQLSGGTAVVSEQAKLQALAGLGEQQTSGTLSDSDKSKLLESLK